jgi:stage V sporulation protein AE
MPKKRVIVVTDGDRQAAAAVEQAARNVDCRCVSLSGGHGPHDAYLEPEEVVKLVLAAPSDPVVVMVDDEGQLGEGRGERILRHFVEHSGIEVLGVVAVASDAQRDLGVEVTESVSRNGDMVSGPVNQEGIPQKACYQQGDTLGVLRDVHVPVVIGLGDPGKMGHADDACQGAPLTTKALKAILAHHSRV